MEEGHVLSIQVHRLNAKPVDIPSDSTWEDARKEAPWLLWSHLEEIGRMHPGAAIPQTTIISSNHDQWPSMSCYLEEVFCDPSANAIHADMDNGVVQYDHLLRYCHAERADMNRETPLFIWKRPLIRIATHIVIRGHGRTEEAVVSLDHEFPQSLLTRADDEVVSLLCKESPLSIIERVHHAIRPDMQIPRPW